MAQIVKINYLKKKLIMKKEYFLKSIMNELCESIIVKEN
jgi:hypothetical protein